MNRLLVYMKKATKIWISAVAVIVLVFIYLIISTPGKTQTYSSETFPTTNASGTTSQTVAASNVATKPVVTIANDPILGDYLVAQNGMTLYKYDKDTPGISNCMETCAANWPPYSPPDAKALIPGPGVTGKLTLFIRTDEKTQLSYNGSPLYFWRGDTNPGDTTGENIGGAWKVAKP